ncbi:MAG: RsmF rRNA methyltransferase first C-terminal domain-containing protein [Lachnospiraceae bacterium]
MTLPQVFEERMRNMLQSEFEEYLASFKQPRWNGIRVNRLKMEAKTFYEKAPFSLEPVPWCENGFYYKREENLSRHPFYHAGLYYIQEPSAMSTASFLPVCPGDKVLDLCAAPGGKSTELGGKLMGEGLLVSNDISVSRTKALLHNIEMAGISNVLVLSEEPAKLVPRFRGFFDKILVDAPCSGEGMFRKDPAMVREWSEEKVALYSGIQKEIIVQAAKMLKPGGKLIYSTCTFAPDENEKTVEHLLRECEDMFLIELPMVEGFDKGHPEWGDTRNEELKKCRRIWPHKVKGEGHFVALFEKRADSPSYPVKRYTYQTSKLTNELEQFLMDSNLNLDKKRIEIHGEKVFYMPKNLPDIKGLRIVRAGLFLGYVKKKRFEPSQAFAMSLREGEFQNRINLSLSDENVIRYLKGETINAEGENGYALVCVENQPLGFGKLNRGILKNKYNPSWRLMRG